MQNLDIISVNLWSILISLANLVLLFLIIKKFLYQPVKNMMQARKEAIDGQYHRAEEAEQSAMAQKTVYENKLAAASEEADLILQSAVQNARDREKDIVTEAKNEADRILRRAEENAAMELKKAENTIKNEIVEVSAKISEKILQREISARDHEQLIDRLIEEIGEASNETQQ